jgi:ribosomal protein L40E
VNGVAGFVIFIVLLLVGIFIFGIYFVFKQVQFVVQAVNLYKKMITRQDVMLKLLRDIRDNTKSVDLNELDKPKSTLKLGYCPICNKPDIYYDANGNIFCPNCKVIVDKDAVRPLPKETVTVEPLPETSPQISQKIPASEANVESQKVPICPHCLAEVSQKAKFCRNCGALLEQNRISEKK